MPFGNFGAVVFQKLSEKFFKKNVLKRSLEQGTILFCTCFTQEQIMTG